MQSQNETQNIDVESKLGGKSTKLNQNLDGSNLELTFDGRYLLGNFGKVKRPPSSFKEQFNMNKLAKLGDAIAISKSETITDSLTDPLTDRAIASKKYCV